MGKPVWPLFLCGLNDIKERDSKVLPDVTNSAADVITMLIKILQVITT